MPINWSNINPNKGAHLLRPREIYAALPDRRYPRLRPEQSEVLEAWFVRRAQPGSSDLVIKQNTGGGKTLVGLLIAQSSLNEGVGPAVYLVPDRFLIQQVVDEAKDAGLSVTTDLHDLGFRSGHATLVTTFHKLMNGRSAFGVLGIKQVLPLGTVIVDDAHTALSNSRSIFAATVPADCAGYVELLALFEVDLKAQSPKAYADLRDGQPASPLRVPPKAVADRADRVLAIVRKYADDADIGSLLYAWPYVADSLNLAIVTFSRQGVQIKTPCPQVDLIPAFAQAQRRIYLTATLADESVLVTELGASAVGVTSPITPGQASDLGDRMILAPLSINPSLTDDTIRRLARDFADGDRDGDGTAEAEPVNVIVLVPGDYAAYRWSGVADQTLHVGDMASTIARLTDGQHVGVVVLVNKYDGVDLPADACRLLIIDGIPSPLTPHEQRESAALTGSMAFKIRQVHKLEQGMGRGIRDVEDHCAVLVLTNEAALTLRDPKLRNYYSPATREQIGLSQQIAEQIEGEGIGEIRSVLDMFLQRAEPWVSKSREATADVQYDQVGTVTPLAQARRDAFDLAVAGDADGAVRILRTGIDTVAEELSKGWWMEELATYEQLVNPVAAQKTLSAARARNPAVLKPAVSSARKPIRGRAAQAAAAAEYLAATYDDPSLFRLSVGALFDSICWGVEETADQAEEQIRLLGLHLGFVSTRPEKEDRDGGPDNLWAMSPKVHAVIELKTEVSRSDPVIIKSEAEQLVHSIVWDEETHADVETRIPVMIHPSSSLSTNARLPAGSKIITREHLDDLKADVTAFVAELASGGRWSDPAAVSEALQRHQLSAELIVPRHSVAPTTSRRPR